MNFLLDDFSIYYRKYLNLDNKKNVCNNSISICKQRDIPINKKYYHHLIATKINNELIISITPNLYNDFTKYIKNKKIIINDNNLYYNLENFFKKIDSRYKIRNMYRMSLQEDCSSNIFNNDTKNIIEIKALKKFLILKNEKVISYSKISNIDYNGANIVVWTLPMYRGKGYAKSLVYQTVDLCNSNKLIPIYLVDANNIASIKLAESLNFNIICNEIIASIEI